MQIVKQLQEKTIECLTAVFGEPFSEKDFQINQTRPEFEGDYTVVLFSLVKRLKSSPDSLGETLGKSLTGTYPDIFSSFNVVKGFLNLSISDSYWLQFLNERYHDESFGTEPATGRKVMVEYSSPNTNKPLHLGHLRNNFLGWSVARILRETGHEVTKSCVVNDRGIHICKSMVAWQRYAGGATPESTGTKGDHFVGDYYVRFNDEYKKEMSALMAVGKTEEEADKASSIMQETRKMLQDWEAGDAEVLSLWRKMNGWVYEGFDVTYKRIGSDFDRTYYESQTYLLGKDLVEEGLRRGVFIKKEDGSVWIDLTAEGIDEKLVLRKDGTSVYITQDIGLAKQKYDEYKIDDSIYVIADEQNYHMKVLKLICEKLQLPFAPGIYHLSYGMVELPSGKMKSREGTVVDADDIVSEMESVAREKTEELGKVSGFETQELQQLYHTIGLGALKFFLLRVNPKKRMIFDPAESIDFHGFTGPFIQFNHARIRSILRKNEIQSSAAVGDSLLPVEKEIVIMLEQYPAVVKEAAAEHDPSVIAVYVYNLAKRFSSFYNDHSIANAESEEKKQLRLRIAGLCGLVIRKGMSLLGIGVPERM
jgi:arginyl-tRNA synthetase